MNELQLCRNASENESTRILQNYFTLCVWTVNQRCSNFTRPYSLLLTPYICVTRVNQLQDKKLCKEGDGQFF